jgi:cobaltochelatase CobT
VTPGTEIGVWLTPVLTLSFFTLLFWAFFRRQRARTARKPVPDEPDGTPYRVYTTEFDRVVAAREAPSLQVSAEGGDHFLGSPRIGEWRARLDASARWSERGNQFEAAAAKLGELPNGAPLAISLLVDQSGSMRDRIVEVAPAIKWIAEEAFSRGIALEVTGFTTLGWRGGDARKKWKAAGKPKRPGRLCALLDLRYKDFDGPLDDRDWQAMLHPDVLRENVDGETILHAADRLAARIEPQKILIVLSDGAPVDDSTLYENGEKYLYRHLGTAIAQVEQRGDIALGAIGIEFSAGDYYPRSREVTDLVELPLVLASEIADLAMAIPLSKERFIP